MQNVINPGRLSNSAVSPTHSEALPPDVLAAKLESLKNDLKEELAAVVQAQNQLLLQQHVAMRPLLTVADLARTLNVSARTVEKLINAGKIRPLWIKGQRRFHPDTVDAYVRSCESRRRRTRRREEDK